MTSSRIRFGAWVGRALRAAAARLPYFPNPHARCSAHGDAYCPDCHRNPADCGRPEGNCASWHATGMHSDTCANRIRG